MTTYRISPSARHANYAAAREYASRNGRKLSGWTFEIDTTSDIFDGSGLVDEKSFLELMSRWGIEVR